MQLHAKLAAIACAVVVSIPSFVAACSDHPDPAVIQARKRFLQARQASASSGSHVTSSATSSTSPPAGVTPTPTVAGPGTVPTDPFATIPLTAITSGAPSEVTPPLQTTPAAGQQPPISGAPVLPSLTLNPSAYPPENTVPPTDSSQVQAWMKEIQNIDPNILAIKPTVDGTCANDPTSAADTSRCWWTCGGCTNSTAPYEDIVTCPDKMTWGLTFDDGPAPYTPKVLNFLTSHQLDATFFIIGSRVMERPAILQAEYMLGHQIGVHTWSHSIPLTALTNEQVVAELGWSRKAIQEVIGVTPIYMRPPYGDIDNRVRAISLAMGMRPIIWTRNPQDGAQFDTNDWKVPGGTVTGPESFAQFQSILTNATQLNTGFIVLQHDLFEQEVDLSTGYSIPAALQAQFKLMQVNKCIKNDPTAAYLETISDKSQVPTYPNAGAVDVKGDGNTTPGTGNGQGAAAQGHSGTPRGLSSSSSLLSISVAVLAGLVGSSLL